MKQTTLETVKEVAAQGDYKLIPVCREIYSDIRTPLEVLRAFMKVDEHCFILESAEDAVQQGRYTFIGYDPSLVLTCKDHKLTILNGEERTVEVENPGAYIQQLIDDHKSPKLPGMPPLTGGLVGYFAYDYIKYGEPSLHLEASDPYDYKDLDLMLFDKLVCFDNYRQRILMIANVHTERLEEEYEAAVASIDKMEHIIRYGELANPQKGHFLSELTPRFSEAEYCEKVAKVKHHIYEGDIFQLVLSNPMEAKYEGSLLNTYRVLRTTNPSPYMFYFSGSDVEIAGASPETLVKIEEGTIRTFPLAGTRPRGKNKSEDDALEEGLLKDEKECAEHNMLVDLGRNDLGKICDFGTVEVERYMDVLKYSHVMHIGSCVKGQVKKGATPTDAVDAVLPAGTLSGAPKIRACEIINELEGDKRGIYGGAIGYIDFAGNLDVCIAIRLAFKHNGVVTVRAGAGIVADSVPESEYQECLNKAKAVKVALEEAEDLV